MPQKNDTDMTVSLWGVRPEGGKEVYSGKDLWKNRF